MSYSTRATFYSNNVEIAYADIPACCKTVGNQVICKDKFCGVKNCRLK